MNKIEVPWGSIPDNWIISSVATEAKRVTDYVANGSFASLAENVEYKAEEDYAVLIRLVDYNNSFKGPFVFIDEKAYNFLSKSKLFGGEIIISNVGANVGTVFLCPYLKYNMSLAPNSITVHFKGNDIFYYYWLRSKYGQHGIKSLITGSAQPKFNKTAFRQMLIPVPPLDVQNQIAGILSSLDAKIETNNKLNEKLEEMAQAIFKSWFVDFEPFKDKPFHETEIGYIPQIFESGVLGDLCTFKRGKGLLSKDAIFGNVPVIAGGMKPACYHNIANTKAPVVTVSGSGANAGYTQIHNVDVWASDCSFIDSNCENLYYVYCFLSRRPKLLRHSQTGAAQPHVKPADIHRFQVVIPTKDVINEFQQIVKPLFDRIGMNKKENDRLASLRDTLLPRLMSGELIV